MAAVAARFSAFDGLTVGSHDAGPLSLVWGMRPGAPFDRASESDRHALIIGDAMVEGSGSRTTASEHLRLTATGRYAIYDGFHIAVAYDDLGGFEIGVDLIGLMPMYHVKVGDVSIAATSPALMHEHPSFRPKLDPFGFAGVLTTNGLLEGRTIYAGVRRLGDGHALLGDRSGALREERRYVLPITSDLHDAPLDICAEEMYGALRSACRRHVPESEPHSLMLSGGLDSRMLAGALVEEGRSLTAFTRGRPSDIEYRCAHGVAAYLELEHVRMPHHEEAPEAFGDFVRWEGLTTAPGTGGSGSGAAGLAQLHPFTVTGYMGTAVLGGSHVNWNWRADGPAWGYPWVWKRLNRWALPVPVLERLLRRDVFGTALDDAQRSLRRQYDASGDTEYERAYRTNVLSRQRFGIGDVLSSLAFGAWPRSPSMDRELLHVSGAVPAAIHTGRRLQIHVLRKFQLGLACLPLDRNSYDTRPIEPRVKDVVAHAFMRNVRAVRHKLGLHEEERYYVRTYDINGPHWRAVRRLVEPFRERAYTVFERDAFDELLPGPDVTIPTRDGIQDVSGIKTLLGWLALDLEP